MARAFSGGEKAKKLDVLTFTNYLDRGKIDEARLYDKDHVIKGELDDGRKYTVKFPELYTEKMTDLVRQADVNIEVDNQKDSVWLSLLFNFAPFILILLVIAFFMNQVQGG